MDGFKELISSTRANPFDEFVEKESKRWKPLPHQVPPAGNWYGWLLMAGRGAGKTDASAQYVAKHVAGPPCLDGPAPHWIAIIAPTLGDAATACFSGPSGIRAHDPSARMTSGAGGLAIKWPNGSEAKLFGAHSPEDVERLRAGGNRCLVWAEELAAWRYLDECFNHMRFGLRVGPRPHWISSTTPKSRPLIKRLMLGEIPNVVVTRATTYDNPHLAQDIRDALEDAYGGTALGAQELSGELVEQDENALWTRSIIDDNRIDESDLPELARISVGVDPSGGAGEQGIVVVGKAQLDTVAWNRYRQEKLRTNELPENVVDISEAKSGRSQIHGFVLADRSCRLSPDGWGRRAVRAAIDFNADDIIVETNFGGDMAIATVNAAAQALGMSIPVRKTTASRGKRPRAEPVAALTEQGRWHHVGVFNELEDQLCTWTPESDWSPDRLDAMVWPAWHMRMVGRALTAVGTYSGRAMLRRIT